MKTTAKTPGKLFLVTLMIAFLSLSSSSVPHKQTTNRVQDNGTGLVTLCHSGQSIQVSTDMVQYHLRHGDYLGKCLADTR